MLKELMMQIPNFIDESVPLGKDDSENVEIEKYGEPFITDHMIFHIMLNIIANVRWNDKEASGGTVAGNGFYYLMGDVARFYIQRLLSYARDFMINKGFTYCIPPYHD